MSAGHDYPPVEGDSTLLPWLLLALAPMNRTRVKDVLRTGRVCVNNRSTTRHDHPLHAGDLVSISRHLPARIPVVYEDDAVIVVDKPSGLLTVATVAEKDDTAFVRLASDLNARRAGRPFVVHRLDRGTSGLLLFARTAAVRDTLQSAWDAVEKTYLAVVEGTPPEPTGRIENFLLEGKNLRVQARSSPTPGASRAVSQYRLRDRHGSFSLVEVRIETGRKHQIRVHLAGLGCPVVGDADYGATTDPLRRLGLHAWRLAFPHPTTGIIVNLESPMPKEFELVQSGRG